MFTNCTNSLRNIYIHLYNSVTWISAPLDNNKGTKKCGGIKSYPPLITTTKQLDNASLCICRNRQHIYTSSK